VVALFGVYCIVVVDVKTAMTSASTPATAMVVVVVMLVASMMATVRGHVVSEDIASFRQHRPPIL
jgi:hypothetical protein